MGCPETGRYQPARRLDDTLRDLSRPKRLTAGELKMTRSWIPFTRGRFVRQARVGLGDLREEHLSRQGFAGPVAMLYRADGPNAGVRVEGDYRPAQIDSADVVAADAADPRGAPLILLSNEDVAIAISR